MEFHGWIVHSCSILLSIITQITKEFFFGNLPFPMCVYIYIICTLWICLLFSNLYGNTHQPVHCWFPIILCLSNLSLIPCQKKKKKKLFVTHLHSWCWEILLGIPVRLICKKHDLHCHLSKVCNLVLSLRSTHYTNCLDISSTRKQVRL